MDRTPSKSLAALWMAGWLTLMLIIVVAGREGMRELNVFQLMEMRTLIGFVLLYPMIHANGGFAILKTARLQMHVARNLIHYGAQLGWFFALTLIPIGQVVAIEFTMPIWTAILAAMFLGERVTLWKAGAIALGLIGVLLIVRPAAGEINPGQLFALAAAVGFGIVGLVHRRRLLRHILALLHDAGAASCRCDRRHPDGLLAGSAYRGRRLAALFGTARCLYGTRRGADPGR